MRPALIYMHIPKCGGTTLTSILKKAVSPRRRYSVADGNNIADSRAGLAKLSDRKRRRIDLLYGHLSYGWHGLLWPRPARYFTLVREPVARVVSHYNYICNQESHYLHADVVGRKMTVADYVESGITTEVNNGQVRQISGVEDIIQVPYGRSVAGYGVDHSALLKQAIENIERDFLLVGLLERFDESLDVLKQLTGLPIGAYRPKNVANSSSAVKTPTRDEIEVVRRYNREDWELYERCKGTFEVQNSEGVRSPADEFFPLTRHRRLWPKMKSLFHGLRALTGQA